jgi:arsenate reductase (glutaredoxin)
MKIYHNPRCTKSRETLALLQENGINPEVVEYLKKIPSVAELKTLLGYLDITPIELVRTKEVIWKDKFKGKELSEEAIVQAMVDYPKLIERPIVVKQKKAVLGRPPQNILELI